MYLHTVSESPSEKHEEKFHDYLTLLTSTETQLTQARFKLGPSGTRSVVMPVNSVLSHLIQRSDYAPLRSGLI